ncbi:arylamine N-acetyltransferase family protein [Nocardia sp. 004]|uniref:arylamine N-acetyltransferase family protein n=1 Tax=Nocardia sp. 004 TaxID=3385978 RepID=UPI0039A363B4
MSKPTDPAYHWGSADLDLDAYLTRIGFDGEHVATVATLHELVRTHTTSIPFENLEIILGRSIDLDLAALQAKIVRRRRGGYCHEHVVLFAAALERLGFGVTGLSGRVNMGARAGLRPATHALLRVTTAEDDRIWLCDVGFGSGPLVPFELSSDTGVFEAGGWQFRLERTLGELDSELWVLHQFGTEGWVDRHSFTLNPQYRIDFVVGNHFVSTSPRSPFTTRPYVQRFHPDVHYVLDGTEFVTQYPDGTSETRELRPTELPKMLVEVFDIDLTDADADVLTAAQWLRDER